MNLHRPILNAIAMGISILALASPSRSFAHDQEQQHRCQQRQIGPQDRVQWLKMYLDQEAATLEIKASQENAWEAFSAATTELMTTFGERKALPSDGDAAAILRQHAEQATTVAQKITKLADATEKLQVVLNEDQRKVLDRIVRLHSQFPDRHASEDRECHEPWHRGPRVSPNASKLPPKAATPAKPKN